MGRLGSRKQQFLGITKMLKCVNV